MDLDKLTNGDKVQGACGILLFLGLLLFPWHSFEFGSGPFKVSESCNAIDCTGEFWGFLALLLTVAVVGVLVVLRFTSAELPEIPISWNQALFYGSIAVGVLLLLKLILETDFLGWGAWVNLILAAGMIAGGFMNMQEGESSSSTPEAF